jgi:hypothetical protein
MMQKEEEQPRPAILRTLAFASKLFRRSRAVQQQRVLNANPYLLCENSSSSHNKHFRKQRIENRRIGFQSSHFYCFVLLQQQSYLLMQSTYSFSEDDNTNKLSSSYSSFWKRNSRMASIFATHCDSPRLPFLQHQHRRHEKEEAWFIFSRHNSLSLSLSLSLFRNRLVDDCCGGMC